MPTDWIIGIGILLLVIIVALVLRAVTSPKEIEMVKTSYVEPKPAKAPKYTSNVSSAPSGDFRFLIQDVFTIKERGTVVTGLVESGTLRLGERVRISDGITTYETTVKGIESFRKKQASATIGDNVGLLLADLSKAEVKQGMLLTNIA
jgi:translation elongation factor EF-Tu-like GTPase